MQRLLKITSLLLLAIWLPATMHCRLEAAGFFEQHDDCASESSSTTSSDCKNDVCPTVEATLIKESAPALTINAPAECGWARCLALTFEHWVITTEPLLSPVRQAPPLELSVRWQFFRRAAPLSRAPSLLTA